MDYCITELHFHYYSQDSVTTLFPIPYSLLLLLLLLLRVKSWVEKLLSACCLPLVAVIYYLPKMALELFSNAGK
jgi:hypothetical protein